MIVMGRVANAPRPIRFETVPTCVFALLRYSPSPLDAKVTFRRGGGNRRTHKNKPNSQFFDLKQVNFRSSTIRFIGVVLASLRTSRFGPSSRVLRSSWVFCTHGRTGLRLVPTV